MSGRSIAAIAVGLVAAVAAYLYVRAPADDASAVRERLRAFASEVNASTTDGLGMEARGVQLGTYFTNDVEIDLGQGTTPIRGRETVIGMAVRLQPRTAAFELRFEDVGVSMAPGADTADVHLTAEFIRRSITTGEESLDAKEFALAMRRVGGQWQIGRATAVETLKQQ